MNRRSREDSAAAALAPHAVDRVDESRLWQRHMQMAEIGAIANEGVNRAAFSNEDIAARQLLVSWARERDFNIAVDDIGNLFVRRDGADPHAAPVMAGSHMDSQPRGGRFDGIYGVLAAFEALEAMDEVGALTHRPVEVVAWSNEEGGRFAPCTMGSMVYTGARGLDEVLDVTDNEGIVLRNALARTLAAMPQAVRRSFGLPPACYLEAHIEQGPLLEKASKAIGIVTGIQGLRWFNVEVFGKTDHAGTTPLSLRHDALRDALQIISKLQQLTDDPSDVTRFTVGRLVVTPNSPNSVASHVLFSVDLRHPDRARLDELGNAVETAACGLALSCTVKVTATLKSDPTLFDSRLAGVFEAASTRLDLSHMRMSSGATHDALYMSHICPSSMIFVPCKDGISHNEAESAKPEDLAAGARVLTAAMLELANIA